MPGEEWQACLTTMDRPRPQLRRSLRPARTTLDLRDDGVPQQRNHGPRVHRRGGPAAAQRGRGPHAYPGAPPILQWDREEARNPFSVYFYNGGSLPSDWGLASGWIDVDAVTLRPEQWNALNRPNGTKTALFVLSGARDHRNGSLGLFPENMRSELHAIRSTIEAFSRAGTLSGADDASANGVAPGATDKVRVTTATGRVIYLIDRWD